MLNGRRILAIVPARGGSKGVPLKNLRSLLGRPLVAHAADAIREAAVFDRAVVSTDNEEIACACEAAGIAAPFRRPEPLSGDRIGDLEVLQHALLETERIDAVRYDIVAMVQPTSPLRVPAHLAAAVEKLVQGGFDAVWTVSRTDLKYHPLKQLTIGPDGRMDWYDPRGAEIVARQQLAPVYHRNGAAYAFTRECLIEQRTILGRQSAALVIDEPMVSIDTLADFETVEAVLRSRAGDRVQK
ncbi:MAG: acylneuraminate cytidylyltransferase family protein [Planctomycetes bacterium]|nr:acylneuraminate cytidylyltransferase family protein [Planctomycetota bacterium]